MNRKAIIYTRVSTDDQADKGYSLQDQKAKLEDYCRKKDIEILKHFQEDYSAKDFNRPVFHQLLHYVKQNKGKIHYLLFVRWDRFSRNTADSYAMINSLRKLMIEPQATEQPLNPESPENKLLMSFYLTVPEVENDRRSLNTTMGMRRAMKEGRYPRRAPKGYINSRDADNKPIIVVDKKKGEILEEAFNLLATGTFGVEQVRKIIHDKGFKCSKSNFARLVKNRFYIGEIFIHSYKEEPDQYVKGLHQPIIDKQTFVQVQSILENRRADINHPPIYKKSEKLIFRGNIICSECGERVTGSKSKGNGGYYYYYHCNHCRKVRIKAEQVDRGFEKLLQQVKPKKEVLNLYRQILQDLKRDIAKTNEEDIPTLNKSICALKSKIERLQDRFVDEQLSFEEYKSIRSRYESKLNALQDELNKKRSSNKHDPNGIKKTIFNCFNLPEIYNSADMTDRLKIIGSIFPRNFIFSKNKCRTNEINEVIRWIIRNNRLLEASKKEESSKKALSSRLVTPAGVEPTTFRTGI